MPRVGGKVGVGAPEPQKLLTDRHRRKEMEVSKKMQDQKVRVRNLEGCEAGVSKKQFLELLCLFGSARWQGQVESFYRC